MRKVSLWSLSTPARSSFEFDPVPPAIALRHLLADIDLISLGNRPTFLVDEKTLQLNWARTLISPYMAVPHLLMSHQCFHMFLVFAASLQSRRHTDLPESSEHNARR